MAGTVTVNIGIPDKTKTKPKARPSNLIEFFESLARKRDGGTARTPMREPASLTGPKGAPPTQLDMAGRTSVTTAPSEISSALKPAANIKPGGGLKTLLAKGGRLAGRAAGRLASGSLGTVANLPLAYMAEFPGYAQANKAKIPAKDKAAWDKAREEFIAQYQRRHPDPSRSSQRAMEFANQGPVRIGEVSDIQELEDGVRFGQVQVEDEPMTLAAMRIPLESARKKLTSGDPALTPEELYAMRLVRGGAIRP